jgi:hypothetical protein
MLLHWLSGSLLPPQSWKWSWHMAGAELRESETCGQSYWTQLSFTLPYMCTSGVSMFFILHVIMGCPLLQKGDECDTLPCSTHLILYKKPVSICLKTRTCRRSCELLGKIRSQPQSHVCVCVCVCVLGLVFELRA